MKAATDRLIPCHVCERQAPLVRSVKIRHEGGGDVECRIPMRMAARLEDAYGSLDAVPKEAMLAFARRDYRRAFICERCYKHLDRNSHRFLGPETIEVAGEVRSYRLSGDSRQGRAAVYDYNRWSRFQARKGA